MLVVILADLNLWRLNKRNANRRVAEGRSAHVNDYSMMTAKEAEAAKAAAGGGDETTAHAFDDVVSRSPEWNGRPHSDCFISAGRYEE